MGSDMKIFLAFVAIMVLTATANLLMKTGAMQASSGTAHWMAMLNWRVIGGIFGLGLAAFIYVWLLRWLPLNIVQSFGAAQFIVTVVAAAVILHERISPGQWIGIILIACGISIVAWYTE